MELVYAYLLTFLQLTFVLIAIMLLHSMKRFLGNGPFYMAMGGILLLVQIISAAELQIAGDHLWANMHIGPLLLMPFIATLLIIYIMDGTTEAQRMIFGIAAVCGIFVYLSHMYQQFFTLPTFDLSPMFPSIFMGRLFDAGRRSMIVALLSILIEFLILPIIYQVLRNKNFNLAFSVFGALIFTQVLDLFCLQLTEAWRSEDWLSLITSEGWWHEMRTHYLFRVGAMVCFGALTNLYLHLQKIPVRTRRKRDVLDILDSFLGAYGQTRRLQSNLREWEGRYQMVVENTNDVIFLVARSGMVLDANRAAVEKLGYSMEGLHTLRVQDIMQTAEQESYDWDGIWAYLFSDSGSGDPAGKNVVFHELMMGTQSGDQLVLDATISGLEIQGSQSALLVGRDITRRRQLEQERSRLQDSLIHAQRMEAVGKLAGGIAHDFNNLLHAIRGSLDLLDKKLHDHEEERQLVSNIAGATDRAGTLTGQLLGFARGGKYQVERISVDSLIHTSESLFRPMLGKHATLRVVVHPDPLTIEGDRTQLEQVVLNLLINAHDALVNKQGRIVLRAEPATGYTPGWPTDRLELNPERYAVLRVKDDGCGMSEELIERIFEPFYTTKDSKGTGMGLAMCYGCVENHQGWIHVRSEVGKGTEFFVFLPKGR